MNATPYIENGKWKLFDKTYTEQTEADKILFDGFFNTIRKHIEFLTNERAKEICSNGLFPLRGSREPRRYNCFSFFSRGSERKSKFTTLLQNIRKTHFLNIGKHVRKQKPTTNI